MIRWSEVSEAVVAAIRLPATRVVQGPAAVADSLANAHVERLPHLVCVASVHGLD